ncbi:MAG: rhodanese-like domain-containing protein [Ruminococcus sp.]|nr:rhodanese-like domain-containing protein [Ruminococcus sp.]
MGEYKKISFEQAKAILDSEPDSIIFDVREEEEYVTGHADGAVCFPIDSINAETAEQMIPCKSTTVMVYCRSGSRSYESAQKLLSLGYENVCDLGSLVGWPFGMEWG